MALTEKGIELLQRVKQHVLEEPRRLNMGTWGRKASHRLGDDAPPCGTVGCIAGWCVFLSNPEKIWDEIIQEDFESVSDYPIRTKAAELLGAKETEEDWEQYDFDLEELFDADVVGADGYSIPPQTKAHAEAVAARIDRFIAANQ